MFPYGVVFPSYDVGRVLKAQAASVDESQKKGRATEKKGDAPEDVVNVK